MTPAQFWDIEMQNQRNNTRMAMEANLANTQQQQQMVGGIGEALGMFAGAYQQKEQDKSDAKIYGNLLKFMAPAFGQQGDAMLKEYSSLKSDRDKANFGRTAASMLGPMSNAMMAQGRMGMQQQQPYIEADLKNMQNIASGNVPHGGAPPALADSPLPAIAAPTGATPQSIPGGDTSMQLYNEWKRQRGY